MKKNKMIPVRILEDFAAGDSMGKMFGGMIVLARQSTALAWIEKGRAELLTDSIDDSLFARRFVEVRPQSRKGVETRAL